MATSIPSIRGGQVEKFAPGDRITMTVKAATSVVGGRLVEISGNREIQPAGSKSRKVLGVAMYDGAAGAKVTVATEGVWMLRAEGAIAAGDQVVVSAGADGRVMPVPSATTVLGAAYAEAASEQVIDDTRAIVGIALEAIADGADGPVLLGKGV
jgi:predicted RecA/RadA family phage recombinase